jgi:hypothetical protein
LLSWLSGEKSGDVPAFSGLIHITGEGLQSEDLSFQDVHQDAQKMANGDDYRSFTVHSSI